MSIDEIGNAVITPGVYESGTFPPVEITPPVIDTWWMVNLRMTGQRAADDEDTVYPGETDTGWRFLRSKFVRNARQNATVVTTPVGRQSISVRELATSASNCSIRVRAGMHPSGFGLGEWRSRPWSTK